MHQLNYIYIYDKYMIMYNVDMIKYIYHTRGNRTHVRAYV